MKMQKKVIIGVVATLVIGSIVLYIDSPKITDDENTQTSKTTTESIQQEQIEPDENNIESENSIENKIYETKITGSQSQTMYFGLDDKLTVYFFEDNNLQSEMNCTYEISDDKESITIYYPDSTDIKFDLSVSEDGKTVKLNDQIYKLSNKTKETIFDGAN